jgi:hypothetical protein
VAAHRRFLSSVQTCGWRQRARSPSAFATSQQAKGRGGLGWDGSAASLQLSTLNFQLSTFNFQLSTLNFQRSSLSSVWLRAGCPGHCGAGVLFAALHALASMVVFDGGVAVTNRRHGPDRSERRSLSTGVHDSRWPDCRAVGFQKLVAGKPSTLGPRFSTGHWRVDPLRWPPREWPVENKPP